VPLLLLLRNTTARPDRSQSQGIFGLLEASLTSGVKGRFMQTCRLHCGYNTTVCVCVCVCVLVVGITMGQLAEGCGVRVEVWLPHHKMAASGTTSPRMQQHPTRCRCLRHQMEGAFKTGGACCDRSRVEFGLPHHKMAASGTTSPRMQQHPTRCRCLRHQMEGAFKTGGACCE